LKTVGRYQKPVILTMKLFGGQATIKQLQWLVWLCCIFYCLFLHAATGWFSLVGELCPGQCFFLALIIYGNIKFLFPVYYERGKKLQYVLFVIVLLIGAV